MGGKTITVALACWRPALRGTWRQVLALALLAGLLGGVALGAVAGARRTATAYDRYLTAINASDVFVNVPGWLPGMPATRPYQLISAYFYAWIGLRLAQGTAGTGDLQRHLAALAVSLQRQARQAVHRDVPPPSFTVNRTDVIRNRVQQAIRPEAVALSVFGAAAALAMLVLVGQGLAQMISRSAADTAVLRILGATRAQAALAAALPWVIAVLAGVALAVAGAVALSPLAPVGPVRRYGPDHGIAVDGLVLGAGAAMLGLTLLGLLAVLAVRSVRPRDSGAAAGSSAVARAASTAGLPAAAVVGTRNAFEPGSGVRAVPVRSALLGSIAAVTAVVAAVVFSTSLGGLAAHPARYGWDWDLVIQAESGYGAFTPGAMKKLIRDEPAVAGWSEFAFAQLPVDGKVVPALGLRRDLGSVQPPTTGGRALSAPDQIELGTATLRELRKKVGDRVRIGIAPYAPRRWPSTWPPVPPGRSGPPWSAGSSRPTRTGRRAAATSSGTRGPRPSSTPSRWAASRSRSPSAWPRRRCCRWP